MFTLLNKFVGSHLDVLVKQVSSKDLLSVLVVDVVGCKEQKAKNHLSDKLEVFVVEKHVVVVQEDKRGGRNKLSVFLVERIVNIQIGHIIVPFWVVWI